MASPGHRRLARRLRRVAIAITALLLIYGAGASEKATPPIEQLYTAVRKAFESGDPAAIDQAARAVSDRGAEAVTFLVRRLELQAEMSGDAAEAKASGIRVTILLLGRMNSYPAARAALARLRSSPVKEISTWATMALLRRPRTPPAATGPAATRPGARPAPPADRIVTPEGWFARKRTTRPPEKVENLFVIPLREEIMGKTFDALKRKVIRCTSRGADMIILDMDTWGGGVGASLDIARLLKTELEGTYVVCYVRTRAVSGGALVAMACDEIVMVPEAGKLGDCAPLLVGGKLEGVEREKIETVLREEFAESAERNGYSVALAESMVSIGREVWLVHNEVTDELKYVLKKDFSGRTRILPGLASAPSDDASEWELLRVVVPEGELLTMKSSRALEYGFAAALVKSTAKDPFAELLKHYNVQGEPTILRDSWLEALVGFLNTPVVMGILLTAGIMCAYVELNAPGFGIPGMLALICFAVFFGSRYQAWEIALFLLGVVLLGVEVFVTPGFGVLGVGGILCCIAGLLAMMVPNAPGKLPIPNTTLAWEIFTTGLIWTVLAFLVASVGAAVLVKHLPKVPVAGRIFLGPAPSVEAAPVTEDAPVRRIQPGDTGVVASPCRPVGRVRFGDDLVDAASEGPMIETGSAVRAVRFEGNRLIIERVEDEQ